MHTERNRLTAVCIVFTALIVLMNFSLYGQITTPEQFFGFKPGTDRKLVHWNDMVTYYDLLEKESDCIKVMRMGPSTMGNPFLVVLISSAENLANLDELQKINKCLSDPRGVDAGYLEECVKNGKAVICQSFGLHSSEVAGTQTTPNLTYSLLSGNDGETRRILDNVLFFMIPCFNPDGDIMIHDWYSTYAGTKYEGISMPWLYHKYIGHDTNRDGDFLNMIESQYAAKIMYVDWPPQAYIDHHQMGSYSARFYVPPYCEPIRPYAAPLIWREISWYGSHIAYKLEEEKIEGVINSAMFPGWGHFGWHWITPFHNIAGMLTESASARLASPLYVHPDQLKGGSRQFPEYKAQSTFPSPWKGGWWRLGDIVRQQEIAARALLDHAARNRETVLRNAWQKAARQIEQGQTGDVCAVIVPAEQHDRLTAVCMINTLLKSGVEILRATEDFVSDGMCFGSGSYIIPMAQPKMGLIRNLLLETRYADNYWTRGSDGSVLRPYDLSTHTMNEFMGVNTYPAGPVTFPDYVIVSGPEKIQGRISGDGSVFRMDGRLNMSFAAVNMLLDKGVSVNRAAEDAAGFRQGDFIVECSDRKMISSIAEKTGVDFTGINDLPGSGVVPVKRKRTGIYRRYWGGNMDEGWTRFLLDKFGFPYTGMRDTLFERGGLHKQFDCIIFASDSPEMITGDFPEGFRRWISTDIPDQYKSGLGEKARENIKQFVKKGGTLILFEDSWKFAADLFGLQVANVVEGLDTRKFFCSGSTLHASFDTSHPLAWGMPESGLVLYTGGPVFEIVPGRHNDAYTTVARYADEDLLKSGWLIGGKRIASKPALVCAEYGEGSIVLIGFRAQHRAQTHGTFKILFNALMHYPR